MPADVGAESEEVRNESQALIYRVKPYDEASYLTRLLYEATYCTYPTSSLEPS